MSETIQKAKHILYRLKTFILHKSSVARWVKSKIWNAPVTGTVEIVFCEEQNISSYFKWDDLHDVIARDKLRSFTERYAAEPNVVYKAIGEIVIEPEFGLAIKKGRQFISESGTLSHIFLKPNLIKYLIQYFFRRRYTHYDAVVHCDGFAGLNLCHFIYDTINPILFLADRGMISKDSPLLVSEKVYSRPYFKYVLDTTFLGDFNWVIQKSDEWIKVKSFQKAFVSMEIFKSTFKIFDQNKNPHRKIFLSRKTFFQRNIKNIDRLWGILKAYDFEFIYAEDLSYEDQVKLFREVRYFVGIHGAGLTNLIHSDIPSINVLEIFSESLVHASFYRFLKILGVKYYDAIIGSEFDVNWNFTVNENAFERKVQKLMTQ